MNHETVSERFERLRVELGMPANWLEYTLRHAEELARAQSINELGTRSIERCMMLRALDREKLKRLDDALAQVAQFLVKHEGFLPEGVAEPILNVIQEARDS
jgi:hypothetical protein